MSWDFVLTLAIGVVVSIIVIIIISGKDEEK